MHRTTRQNFWLAIFLEVFVLALLFYVIPPVENLITRNDTGQFFVQDLTLLIIFGAINLIWIKQPIHFSLHTSIGSALLLAWPMYLILLSAVIQLANGRANNLIKASVVGISAGVFEEYLFRGLILGISLYVFTKYKTHSQIWSAVIFSSILFGITHGINAFSQPWDQTALQIISTACFGIFLAALYLRSGSLILPMLTHGLWDFNSTLASTSVFKESAVTGQEILIQGIFGLFFILLAIFYLRKKRTDSLKINF